MSTWYQTAYVCGSSPMPLMQILDRPLAPVEYDGTVRVTDVSGVQYTWYSDGSVHVIRPDGVQHIFPSRPTFGVFLNGHYSCAEMFLGNFSVQTYTQGNYFEFHSDGFILYRRAGVPFVWGPSFPCTPVAGEIRCTKLISEEDCPSSTYERRDSYS